MRNCPLCELPMTTVALSGEEAGTSVEVERCDQCLGIFLDRSETEESLGLAGRLLDNSDGGRQPAKADPLHCPGCSHQMDVYQARGVLMDVCGQCEGVWLDNGELDSLRYPDAEPNPGEEGGLRDLMDRVALLTRFI